MHVILAPPFTTHVWYFHGRWRALGVGSPTQYIDGCVRSATVDAESAQRSILLYWRGLFFGVRDRAGGW